MITLRSHDSKFFPSFNSGRVSPQLTRSEKKTDLVESPETLPTEETLETGTTLIAVIEGPCPKGMPKLPPTRILPFPIWKRALDLTLVLITSPIWLPLMVLVCLWIKMVSRGDVLFRQNRVGHGGRPFIIYKFRSMKSGANPERHEDHVRRFIKNDEAMVKLDALNDERLIPGGRLLRALGLDELPQFFNVLLGEMSLVGPRPCTIKEYFFYEESHKARFAVPPGLTGYWQVSGKNLISFSQMVALDIRYAKRMSPLLDLAILFATIPTVMLQVADSYGQPPQEEQPMETSLSLGGHATQHIS